ncbi:sugar ABC transporter substrate-binding protein [Pseudarthrobacter sp. DSP2-3-2b1]|uniref:sugar ABC transporter substrate-binding protein n=1 Tax=Pseudarthrobacter sp. DSP2-3-2b1 TaxID=2804661 RepID=UPI003CECD808
MTSIHQGILLKAAALTAVAGLAMTGCSAAESAGSEGKEKIGIALPAGNQTFWTSWQNGARDAAAKLGVEATFSDAKGDANTQNDQVNSLLVGGAKGIIIASVDPKANASVAQAAADSEAILITGNRTIEAAYGGLDGANPRVHVGFNDVAIGKMQGELVVEACKGIDPCQVVLQEGTLGATPQIQRTEGLMAGIKSAPNVKIIDKQSNDFDPTKAVEVTQTLLQKHAKIDIMLAQTDPEAVAAARVVAEQGRQDAIKVIGIGGSMDGTAAVESGALYGTVWVSAKADASAAVETLVKIMRKESVDVATIADRPTVEVAAVKVTKANVAQYPGEW